MKGTMQFAAFVVFTICAVLSISESKAEANGGSQRIVRRFSINPFTLTARQSVRVDNGPVFAAPLVRQQVIRQPIVQQQVIQQPVVVQQYVRQPVVVQQQAIEQYVAPQAIIQTPCPAPSAALFFIR